MRIAVGLVALACATGGLFAGQFESPRPVRAPDVFGGWASDHIIVRLMPGVLPGTLPDGRMSFVADEQTRGTDAESVETAIADVLARWQVTEIEPGIQPPPQAVELARRLGLDRYWLVRVPRGTDTPTMVVELSRFPSHIERAELDGIAGALETFPNDQYFSRQYALHNTGQNVEGQPGTPDADVDAPEAWDLHTGTADIIIAIIDTGVSHSHPDLAAKLIPGRNTQDDNNDTDDSILISHGTHCAGIASAISNNGQGIAGVSWGALIMPIKVLNWLGMGTDQDVAEGIIWAADHGAHVGSLSLGSAQGSSILHDAVVYAYNRGMVLCCASGNDGGPPILYPARYPETIAVGATDNRDQVADFTSTGPEMSVAAPGVNIYSCWDTLFSPNTYSYQSGTSMACPHVSGLAALVWSANPTLTNDEVRAIIESTADDKGAPGHDPYYGYGRINAYAAVAAAAEPIPGDVNGDGRVDLLDLAHLLAAYGACVGDPNYNPDADFDDSGCVDLVDLAVLLANYGYGT